MTRILITRRALVVAGGSLAAGLALTTPAHARLLPTTRGVGRGRFLDGVASGEPSPDAVTFWGRLTTSAPRSAARLIVAEDQGLSKVVATTVVPTSAGVDHTLKTRIGGLKAADRRPRRLRSHLDADLPRAGRELRVRGAEGDGAQARAGLEYAIATGTSLSPGGAVFVRPTGETSVADCHAYQ